MVRDILTKEAQAVREWALQHNAPDDLSCWCAICSYEIFKRLKQSHLRPTFVHAFDEWEGHCFILCSGYLIDVTAQQFNRKHKPVIVSKEVPTAWYWGGHNTETNEADTVEGIKQILSLWPKSQKPRKW